MSCPLSPTFNVDVCNIKCILGRKNGKSTLKKGEGGVLKHLFMILGPKMIVLPTILSSGVWGHLVWMFDLGWPNWLPRYIDRTYGPKNRSAKIRKNVHLMTSFYDVINFFGMLLISAIFNHFGDLSILRSISVDKIMQKVLYCYLTIVTSVLYYSKTI